MASTVKDTGTTSSKEGVSPMSAGSTSASTQDGSNPPTSSQARSVRFVLFKPNTQIVFKVGKGGGANQRTTVVDLRAGPGDYKVVREEQHGIYVERDGYLPKLIPWHNIEDVDYEAEATAKTA